MKKDCKTIADLRIKANILRAPKWYTSPAGEKIIMWGHVEITPEDVAKIKKLNDYKTGANRELIKKHGARMRNSFRKIGFAGGIRLVLYKEEWYLVDGQHRVFAMLEGMPLFADYVEVFTDQALFACVMGLNENQLNWNNRQYISNGCAQINVNYFKLRKALETTNISTSCTCAIISEKRLGVAKELLHNGGLIVTDNGLKQLKSFDQFVRRLDMGGGQRLVEGLILAVDKMTFQKFDSMLTQIADNAISLSKVLRLTSTGHYENMFTSAYNSVCGQIME